MITRPRLHPDPDKPMPFAGVLVVAGRSYRVTGHLINGADATAVIGVIPRPAEPAAPTDHREVRHAAER
jgi:hypothetical protein